MPVRTQAPEFKSIDEISIQEAVHQMLKNGVNLFTINAGSQEIIKIEFLFQAGARYQPAPLVASAVSNLINEGTINRHGSEINEIIDYYGAFLQTESGKDNASVILYTLVKHLDKVLPIIKELISEASFPEDEINIYKQNSRQKFQVENQKVNHLARKHFLKMLYGEHNHYGYLVKENDFDGINQEALLKFYQNRYSSNYCTIIASGFVTEGLVDSIISNFDETWGNPTGELPDEINLLEPLENNLIVEKSDAVQSAIRIGRPLFNKTDPDFQGMQVLNTILGGYFGSRLMANIREEKGYTYGIGSGIASLQKSGYFFISTEVGVDVCQKAIDEIFYEIKRLRDELVPEDEMELVRNYMLGVFLKNADGAFSLADRFKAVYEYGLGYEYYDRMFNTIRTITPEEIQKLANKYLNQESLLELVVGKK
ncbi:MAG: insulinase family protein [Bacteroidetes bacterium]|nr:insulinase family protein [Bacteroidota bacterium]